MWQQSEIEAIAIDHADAAASRYAGVIDDNAAESETLAERVEELESENRLLRAEVDGHKAMIDELYDNQQSMTDYINNR